MKKTLLITALVALSIGLVLIIVFTLFVSKQMETGCENKQILALSSPDETKKVVYFSRKCGKTSTVYGASMLNASSTLSNAPGNMYTAADPFAVKWLDAKTVAIVDEVDAKYFKRNKEADGIIIQYETKK